MHGRRPNEWKPEKEMNNQCDTEHFKVNKLQIVELQPKDAKTNIVIRQRSLTASSSSGSTETKHHTEGGRMLTH